MIASCLVNESSLHYFGDARWGCVLLMMLPYLCLVERLVEKSSIKSSHIYIIRRMHPSRLSGQSCGKGNNKWGEYAVLLIFPYESILCW